MKIELESVSKSYGGAIALHPTDLAMAAGRTTVLLGPSGCGKSTLIRLIVGLVTPDAGVVRVGGEALSPANLQSMRHRMGYVIQEGGLFPHLRARQNVTLMADHLGWPAARIAQRVEHLSALTHLDAALLDRYPQHISGGQRQRVSLMRALMLDPAVLLLDEPLGALDPLIRAELQTELRAVFAAVGKTVVLVTHDLAEAAHFADQVALMRGGRVVQWGPFADLIDRPSDPFVTRFVQAQRGLHFDVGGAA